MYYSKIYNAGVQDKDWKSSKLWCLYSMSQHGLKCTLRFAVYSENNLQCDAEQRCQ